MPMAQYRAFNGSRWRLVWSFTVKADAIKRKGEEAKRGHKARYQKVGGRYYVYVQVKK
jgi:hypothetical protein